MEVHTKDALANTSHVMVVSQLNQPTLIVVVAMQLWRYIYVMF